MPGKNEITDWIKSNFLMVLLIALTCGSYMQKTDYAKDQVVEMKISQDAQYKEIKTLISNQGTSTNIKLEEILKTQITQGNQISELSVLKGQFIDAKIAALELGSDVRDLEKELIELRAELRARELISPS